MIKAVSEVKYKVISAVCETGNFTKAAEKLNYSQSAVSQAVRNFEKELGITLFERSKKGVKPLEEVLPVIESIQKIHSEEEKMKDYVMAIRALECGEVKIAYLGEGIEGEFWKLFQTFGKKYPKIRCEILRKTHREVEKDLENRLLDFAFTFEITVNEYDFLPFGKDELLVFLPKEHRLVSKETITMQDLENENILMTSEYPALEFKRRQKGIEFKKQDPQFYFSEDRMALKFVEEGRGICIMPRSFVDIVEAGVQVEVKSFENKCFQTWGMIYPKDKNLTNAAKKFLEHVFNMYKKHPDYVDSAIGADCKI